MYMRFLSSGATFLILFLIVIVFLSAVLPPFFINIESPIPWIEAFRSTPYSTYDENQDIDSRVSNLIDPTKERQCKKIYGFDGLYCNPDSLNGGIDVFYGLKSNTSCAGSGLIKSNGNLCLDKASYDLLTSRGGNSTGANSTTGTRDSQIG